MKKGFMFKAVPMIFILILVIGCSKVPKFDHYGVYIKEKMVSKKLMALNGMMLMAFIKILETLIKHLLYLKMS